MRAEHDAERQRLWDAQTAASKEKEIKAGAETASRIAELERQIADNARDAEHTLSRREHDFMDLQRKLEGEHARAMDALRGEAAKAKDALHAQAMAREQQAAEERRRAVEEAAERAHVAQLKAAEDLRTAKEELPAARAEAAGQLESLKTVHATAVSDLQEHHRQQHAHAMQLIAEAQSKLHAIQNDAFERGASQLRELREAGDRTLAEER